MAPDVSVLLLTYNGIATLPEVLDAVAGQQTPFTFETVAIDSASDDGTLDLLRQRVDRVLEIHPGQFNHGLTRNAGIESCRGSFVVLLVQDAVPSSPQWLANLVAPLLADERLAGTYARQTPRADASAITRHYLLQWVAAGQTAHVTFVDDPDAFARLPPMDRFLTCVFDNVCSCLRRSVWERLPFKATRIAEDIEWARDVLLAGYGLAYVADSVVVHSHDRSARYELARTYLVHQRLRTMFGLATVPDVRSLLRAVSTTVPLHMKWAANGSMFGASPRTMARALALAVAFPLGQYLGIRSVDTGREFLRPKGV